ncbi:MAG: Ribonuclease HI [Candidatus Woesebacteria bacterium GW2011_GWA1_41_7]|uniref:Ribonuclease HI n=2 Tax=Candidatus Woeseibacteriota TaxID=1752722 RepID=A0A0G0WZ35_9BACT|nr:MAG: Ribonuclease HI [Candidatus Woesebacteria bacterium GW2011_GWE1_41_24]KKS17995.1 MAG: Ribonuclease HI [Candidatus Woesebacteria bacterium GW2011_GWA1_41_7]
MQNGVLIIHTDGGSRGNPGPAACAFVAELDGKVLAEKSKYLDITTNNIAEYQGVLLALDWLLENSKSFKTTEVIFFLDSELVVKQLTGFYRVKKPELQTLNLIIKKKIEEISIKVNFQNIPREQNKEADRLVNEELDLQ